MHTLSTIPADYSTQRPFGNLALQSTLMTVPNQHIMAKPKHAVPLSEVRHKTKRRRSARVLYVYALMNYEPTIQETVNIENLDFSGEVDLDAQPLYGPIKLTVSKRGILTMVPVSNDGETSLSDNKVRQGFAYQASYFPT